MFSEVSVNVDVIANVCECKVYMIECECKCDHEVNVNVDVIANVCECDSEVYVNLNVIPK